MNARILIKIGGKAFEGKQGFSDLSAALKSERNIEVIIVHGGGAEISQALREANRDTVFIDGIRVTQAEDIRIVENVLSGRVNKRIVSFLRESGIHCKGMSGKADQLFVVEPLTRKGQKLGYVGKIKGVNAIPVLDSLKNGQVPIVSPISADERGQAYNVNADSAAAALAVAAQCTDLIYFTDVAGVQVGKKVCSLLTIQEAQDLIANGTIKDGMVAKMESTFEALKGGVPRVHILQWVGANTLAGIINGVCRTGTTLHL